MIFYVDIVLLLLHFGIKIAFGDGVISSLIFVLSLSTLSVLQLDDKELNIFSLLKTYL